MMSSQRAQPEFAVVYDLSDDRERRRVDAVLRGFGFRVQKSVYECRLSRAGRQRMQRALDALQLQSGSVRIYRIYAGAAKCTIGQAEPDIDAEAAYVF